MIWNVWKQISMVETERWDGTEIYFVLFFQHKSWKGCFLRQLCKKIVFPFRNDKTKKSLCLVIIMTLPSLSLILTDERTVSVSCRFKLLELRYSWQLVLYQLGWSWKLRETKYGVFLRPDSLCLFLSKRYRQVVLGLFCIHIWRTECVYTAKQDSS